MLKDVESLSALQGHSSEDWGHLGGDSGEASRSCSRWRDENSCLTRWLSSGPRETRLHQKGISLRDIFCNCHVSDILSLSSKSIFSSLRQIYAEESESAEAPNEVGYWNVEDTEQQLHLQLFCMGFVHWFARWKAHGWKSIWRTQRAWEILRGLFELHPLKKSNIEQSNSMVTSGQALRQTRSKSRNFLSATLSLRQAQDGEETSVSNSEMHLGTP